MYQGDKTQSKKYKPKMLMRSIPYINNMNKDPLYFSWDYSLFAKKYFGAEGFVKEIKRVKFPSPMLPETSVLLNLEYNEQKRSFFFTLCDAFQKDKIFSSGTAFL